MWNLSTTLRPSAQWKPSRVPSVICCSGCRSSRPAARRGALGAATRSRPSQPTRSTDRSRGAVARYQGLQLIALTHADMAAQRRRLVNAGFAMQGIVHLRRRVATVEGERLIAYSVLRTEPGEMAEGRVQMLTNHTPELLWTPGSTVHDNRADALTQLLVCVRDPVEAALRYGRFCGREISGDEQIAIVALERGDILLVSPSRATAMLPDLALPELPYIAGIALRSAELAATQRVLARAAIRTPVATGELICVGPVDALGAFLLFHAGSIDAPWQALAQIRGR